MNALGQYWHPILWSREVTDKPVAVKLLDQPLVIWRADGNLSAFYDLCIHRGAALSLGWVNGDRLVCELVFAEDDRTALHFPGEHCSSLKRWSSRRFIIHHG